MNLEVNQAMLFPRPKESDHNNNAASWERLFSNSCLFSIAWGIQKKSLVIVGQKEDGESECLKQENEMTRWWTYKNPTWSALLGSRDTNPGFLCSGLAQGVRGKRSSVSEAGISELQGQRQCWPTAFLQCGDFWCASNANWDLCPSYTFINKTSLSSFHWSMTLILLWYRFFFYIIILWDSIQPFMT